MKLRKLGKARIAEEDLNPRTQRQRQELYWFMLISVGAALRVGEAYSLRWRDCELITLNDKDNTEAVHMKVLGKHSRGGHREEAYGMFGAVSAFKAMQKARPEAKPDDPLFTENHREGIKELLREAKLWEDPDGRTRDAKSLRQTGHLPAPRPRTQSGLPRHRQVGADEPRDDRLLLRPDAPAAERRAHCWFQEDCERIEAGRRKNG